MLVATALSLWGRAHFWARCSLFVVGARETSCFGGQSRLFVTRARDRSGFASMCRFRGRRVHFGHGANLRRALMS